MSQPRFVGNNDLAFINSISREISNEVVHTPIVLYQVSDDTQYDVYGEPTVNGVVYKVGVQLFPRINKEDQTVTYSPEGVSKGQGITFMFRRAELEDKLVVIEYGDIIDFNDAYFEIVSINNNQFIAGQTNMENQHSIVCKGIMVRRNKLNIEEIID